MGARESTPPTAPLPPDVTQGLVRLVLRLCAALGQLVGNEEAFAEALLPVRGLLGLALTPGRLDEIEARIETLIESQLLEQRGIQEAGTTLRQMLTLVVEQLGTVGAGTERFAQRLEGYTQACGGPLDAAALRRLGGAMLEDARELSAQLAHSREELAQARHKVETFERRLHRLESELEQVARMVQNDPLTHVLNRRGLDEAVSVEMARATRYQVPLSFVMIDLDDFKAINDSLGHAAGDRALVHFITSAQVSLRSTEMIARTGGEEFVFVFPATHVDEAVAAVERLQRALTRSPFDYEGQARLISFSGGAALWAPGESLAQVLRRCDAALYRAKDSGKNRVCRAD